MTVADQLAAELLAGAHVAAAPPIDVELVARRLGIANILDADLVEDGRLELRDGQHTILLRRRDVTPKRRRFTIAHELGHLALGVDLTTGIAHRNQSTDEERLCDEIAAALLIPEPWLRERFASRQRNLSTLRHIAHLSDTSLAASLVRCKEVLRWPESVIRWTNDGKKWRYQGGAGIPPSIHPHVRSAPTTSAVLDSLAQRRRDQQATLPVLVRGRAAEVHGLFSVTGPSAIGLVHFSERDAPTRSK